MKMFPDLLKLMAIVVCMNLIMYFTVLLYTVSYYLIRLLALAHDQYAAFCKLIFLRIKYLQLKSGLWHMYVCVPYSLKVMRDKCFSFAKSC